jgi:hypothetical protein
VALVMVAEDISQLREALQRLMVQAGHEIVTAADGVTAGRCPAAGVAPVGLGQRVDAGHGRAAGVPVVAC